MFYRSEVVGGDTDHGAKIDHLPKLFYIRTSSMKSKYFFYYTLNQSFKIIISYPKFSSSLF